MDTGLSAGKAPELKFPEYYNELDKAASRSIAGATNGSDDAPEIGGDKKGDAVQIALIKASGLSAVGRRDEAVGVLSDAAVAENPKVQVLKARILGELGKWDEGIAILKSL